MREKIQAVFIIIILYLCQGPLLAQVSHDFTDSELSKFARIYSSTKSLNAQISDEDFSRIQLKHQLTKEELGQILGKEETKRNKKEQNFIIDLQNLVKLKKRDKLNKIKELCEHNKLEFKTYNEILQLYLRNTEFQQILCTNI